MLDIKGLSWSINGKNILNEISLSLPDDVFTAVLGATGSGKTTLLKLVAGFFEPSGGEIHINNRLVSSTSTLIPSRERRISMAFQNQALWPHMRVHETLEFILEGMLTHASERRETVRNMLLSVELEEHSHKFPSELSGGQAQTLNLARALITTPSILLLDEPFTGLDPILKAKLKQVVRNYVIKHKPIVLMATHHASEALDMTERIILLRDGTAYFDDKRSEFHTSTDPYILSFIRS